MNEENKRDLNNQEDVNPGTQFDKLVNDEHDGQVPGTNGTGSNTPVSRQESLIIKDERLEDEEDS